MRHKQTLSARERFMLAVIMLLLIAVGSMIYWYNLDSDRKDRDATRLAEITQIENQLREYAGQHGTYPACLYRQNGCVSLEDAGYAVPKDPLTNSEYSYAAFGVANKCTGYHIGSSLERKGSQGLLTGSDAPPLPDSQLCFGSNKDFSGLSFAPGGFPCDLKPGTPQPTDNADGETCYDIEHHRLP